VTRGRVEPEAAAQRGVQPGPQLAGHLPDLRRVVRRAFQQVELDSERDELLPVLVMISGGALPTDSLPNAGEHPVTSPLVVSATGAVAPAAAVTHSSFAAITILGVVLLYLRYRRSGAGRGTTLRAEVPLTVTGDG
jgi:hypothetical protein